MAGADGIACFYVVRDYKDFILLERNNKNGLLNPENNNSVQDSISELEVSPILQPDDYSCVPVCIKMVLDYLANYYDSIPNFGLYDISECIDTTELGTTNSSNLDNINDLFIKCVPSIEFKRDHSYPRWASIVNDLSENKPVILWILCQDEAGRYFDHSVVVTGYKNRNVFYNDPIFGKKVEPIDTFLLKWDEEDRFTIRVKVGERIERKMTEYIDYEQEENKVE